MRYPYAGNTLLLFLVAVCSASFGAVKTPEASVEEFRNGTNLALQGDMRAALQHLDTVSPDALNDEQRKTWACMRKRFRANTQTVSVDWTQSVFAAYRSYWSHVMLGKVSAQSAEHELAKKLAKLVYEYGKKSVVVNMDTIEPLLSTKLETLGYHALFGVTTPMREFMLWHKQTDQSYDVDLPAGRQVVHVVMLDDFVSLGWAGYATCDYYHTAGWAKPDRLYAVRAAYDLHSEAFQVSYLAHEGQHFSDYQHFPGMEQPELEYRAKLAEISKARSTILDLLNDFAANESDSPEQPHPWANRKVVTELAEVLLHDQLPSDIAWKSIAAADINATAERLLKQDTERRMTRPLQTR
ncbi:hypothetical protein ELE36_12895 [Pseudolysobacter antarcticus]|uniref:Uncharacterized protein n=1 Tax=Pseudolysobacter antarcticus TaxID=2511995 RepID=A0A411HLC6_9GAMM|nr:hypothetical protein [Pseudolysobacter antarcticus]QBB71177.1 hypothetical protein ELE36_12895 [Pseudolysobacter antarcticus]